MNGLQFVRLLRTCSSERFIIRLNDSDVAVLEIHYLANGTVQATLIAFAGMLEESKISELLVHIDEVLLPEVSLDDKRLVFTVVTGRVIGAFEAVKDLAIAIED